MKNKKYSIIIVMLIAIILLIGATYAWYIVTLKGTKDNIIKAGTLSLILDDELSKGISLQDAVPVTDTDGLLTEAYTFKLKNNGNISSDYIIYLDDMNLETGESRMLDKYVKYSLTRDGNTLATEVLTEIGVNPNRVLDSGLIEDDTTYIYTLKLWIDKDADNAVMGTTFRGKLRVEASQVMEKNKNIKAVYKYNEVTGESDYCVSGEEATCEAISPVSYSMGTIVKYAVTDTEEKFFYVLHDDGETLTMQQRENTVRNVAWYADANDNTQGPTTALSALESATSTWINVNDQTYTLGTTNFNNTNAFTGCTYSTTDYKLTCNRNIYTLPERTAKARLITGQEAASTSCLVYKDGLKDATILGNSINAYNQGSCPDWMHNYLYQSSTHGGSYSDDTTNENNVYNWGYWMTAAQADYPEYALYVRHDGELNYYYTSNVGSGARAVVVVNK